MAHERCVAAQSAGPPALHDGGWSGPIPEAEQWPNVSNTAGPSQRQQRVAELVRHALAEVLSRGDLQDEVLATHVVTIPEVRMSPDLKLATAFVMPLGGKDEKAVIAALDRNKKHLRHEVARRVNLKFAPELRFLRDPSFDEAARIDALLRSEKVVRDTRRKDEEDGQEFRDPGRAISPSARRLAPLLALAAAGAATMLAPVRLPRRSWPGDSRPLCQTPVGRSADVTEPSRILLPAGTPVAAAVARLGEEGFACGADPGQPGLTRCWRRSVDFPCENTWPGPSSGERLRPRPDASYGRRNLRLRPFPGHPPTVRSMSDTPPRPPQRAAGRAPEEARRQRLDRPRQGRRHDLDARGRGREAQPLGEEGGPCRHPRSPRLRHPADRPGRGDEDRSLRHGRPKSYVFTVTWGAETDTDDAEGRVVESAEIRPERGAVEALLPRFVGAIAQVPPRFSAIKIQGERAYDLARDGEIVALEARTVVIDRLAVIHHSGDRSVLEADCGKGTYVRALARDLGRALGCLGHISALRRTRVGPFGEAEAVVVDAVATDPAALRPVEAALQDLVSIPVSRDMASRLMRGQPVILRGRDAPLSGKIYATCNGVLVAVGDVERGELVPHRVFHL